MIRKLHGKPVVERDLLWPNAPLKFNEMPIDHGSIPIDILQSDHKIIYLEFQGRIVSKYKAYIDPRGRLKGYREHALTKHEQVLFGLLPRDTKRLLEKKWYEVNRFEEAAARKRKIEKTLTIFHAMILGYTVQLQRGQFHANQPTAFRFKKIPTGDGSYGCYKLRMCMVEKGLKRGTEIITPVPMDAAFFFYLADNFNPDPLPSKEWPEEWIKSSKAKPVWEEDPWRD
jgi:hypothetical protein